MARSLIDVRSFIESAPYEEIRGKLAELATNTHPDAIETLKEFLRHKDSHTYYKHAVVRLACLALLQKGEVGVAALYEVIPEAPGSIYPKAIIAALWYASRGLTDNNILGSVLPAIPPLDGPLTESTIEAAHKAVKALVADAWDDEESFDQLIGWLYQESLQAGFGGNKSDVELRRPLFEIFAVGRIKVSERLLAQFRGMIDGARPEEAYQQFLASNPVFLDPLASQVIPKQRLGVEYVTDFVIRRLDDKYLVVEIEKPQDPLFTSAGEFSSLFTHALGQVLDFQQWVDSHGEYARSLMPEISSPRGVLVMGRSTTLTEKTRRKLHRFNVNSSSVEVLTFDDVERNASRLYENMYC